MDYFSWRETSKSNLKKLLNFSENGEADRLNDVPRFCEVSSKEQNA